MDNSESLRDQIYNNMQLKTTEELLFILEQDDHEEWTDTAFEVIRKILIQRTGRLPEVTAPSTNIAGESTDWETINWQVISRKCDKVLGRTSLTTRVVVFVVFTSIIGWVSFSPLPNGPNGLYIFAFVFILYASMFGADTWSYLKARSANRIVAKARVYLKDTRSQNRGSIYDVGFAIKSAFVLSKDGKLIVDRSWMGHHTFSVPTQIYNRIEEQEIVNLIFLSSNQFLGLLEDFKGT
jgi:hypothetical protein